MAGRTLVALASLWMSLPATAAEFAGVFGDRMVLQRDQPITVWGQGAPREEITVTLAEAVGTATVDASGRWQVELPAMPAGGPYQLSIEGADRITRSLSDVLVGDVWLCSGQSNMAFAVGRSTGNGYDAAAAWDSIRLFAVQQESYPLPRRGFTQTPQWSIADADTILEFSAVCFFFARELQKTHPVPLGLIHASWGGAGIAAWMSTAALEQAGGFEEQLDLLRTYASDAEEGTRRFGRAWEDWWVRTVSEKERPWLPADEVSGWLTAPALRDWKTFGDPAVANHDGMVWYRTSFELSQDQALQDALLELGGIDEVDVTWINGRFIGSRFGWGSERTYEVPRGVLQPGRNFLAVNVLSTWDSGGMLGPEDSVRLQFADGDSRPLAEGWEYRQVPLEFGLPPRAPWESIGGLTGLFNAMIAPLQGLRLTGALWYQGETNAGDPAPYAGLLTALIEDWRRRFGGSLKFLVVQLPNFGARPSGPSESGWAAIRDAQRRVARADAGTGLIVTVDAGDNFDLHPANKQVVARRAAEVARTMIFGERGIVDGLSPSRAVRRNDEIVIDFDLAGDSLRVVGDDRPIAFEVCTNDQPSCRYAEARLQDNRIYLAGVGLQDATRVRHCWADAPICNLYGASGLPVGSFEIAIESQGPSR